jgi:hypothetical protein
MLTYQLFTRMSFFWCVLFSVMAVAQPRIDLTEGTVFLSGGFDVRYEIIGFEKPNHKFKLTSDIGGGYFIVDDLAVGVSVPIEWTIGKNKARVGMKFFSTYFFDISTTIFPYLGGNIIPRYFISGREFELLAGIDTGILVSLSESVALDFGIKPEIFFKLYNSQKWRILIPGGFFGIRAVF